MIPWPFMTVVQVHHLWWESIVVLQFLLAMSLQAMRSWFNFNLMNMKMILMVDSKWNTIHYVSKSHQFKTKKNSVTFQKWIMYDHRIIWPRVAIWTNSIWFESNSASKWVNALKNFKSEQQQRNKMWQISARLLKRQLCTPSELYHWLFYLVLMLHTIFFLRFRLW